jgi:hypothetical protein
MTATSRINAFMRAASAQLRSNDSVIAQRMSCALALEQLDAPRLPPAKTPVCALLADLLIDRQEDLLQRLALCAEDLHWRRAGFGKLPYDIDRKLAVTELLGPDGMFFRPDLRIGLLLQADGLHYPNHRHAAEELYFVLVGTACWAVDDAEPAPSAPGAFILHRSLQPHNMVTGSEPMLALWGWSGDIEGSSYAI